jgi:hypothetical protein
MDPEVDCPAFVQPDIFLSAFRSSRYQDLLGYPSSYLPHGAGS